MKRSKLLVMVLALILCVSMLLVGCSKKDDGMEEVTLTEDEQKDEVVKAFNQNESLSLSNLNAKETLEQILGTNVLEVTYKLSEDKKGVFAYKDGYIYADVGSKMWLYFSGTDAALFRQNQLTNKWEGTTLGGNEGMAGSIAGGALSKVKIPEEIKLPELKASDLTVEDGKVVLSNDYIKAAIKQPDLYKALTGTETPKDDVKAAMDGVIDSVVDAFKLKVSFRFSGTKLGKLSIAMNLDASGLSDQMKEALPETLKGSVDFSLNDKADALTGVKVDIEVVANNVTTKVNADVKTIMDGNVIKGLDCSYTVNEKNISIATLDSDTDAEGSINVYGDVMNTCKFKLDLSKVKAEKGTKVFEMEGSYSQKAKKFAQTNPLTQKEKELTAEEAGQKLETFNEEFEMIFGAEVKESGVISYDGVVRGETVISGTLNFNAAPSMPAVPAEITDFVKNKMK